MDDYIFISNFNRKLRRFKAALEVADKAIKLDDEVGIAHFGQACALAQLGNKQDALNALKQAYELDSDIDFDDVDLKPLAKMPGFKESKK